MHFLPFGDTSSDSTRKLMICILMDSCFGDTLTSIDYCYQAQEPKEYQKQDLGPGLIIDERRMV
jgi:hypothetical protein